MSYDADGKLAGYSDGETSAEYNYDDLSRKIWERVDYGTFTKEFFYTYYKNGLKKTLTMPDGTMYEYTYGNNNELREVWIPGLGAVTIPDYTWNRPAKMIFPGGSQRMYGYDALMRLNTLTATDPGGNPLLDYTYTYDPTGNIVAKATEHGNYMYDYDALSRLTGVDNPVLDDETYTYDNVGNRLTSADISGSWSYNQNNELLTFADVEYVYDDNSNMTQKKVGTAAVNYIYNAADRLAKVEDDLTSTVIAEYYYDPFGRRLWKDVGGTKTYFFYADEGLVAEYDASGNEIKSYGYKPDSTWMADPLFMKQGTEYYFYQNDHLGTPQKLVGVNGAVVWSAQYSSFGKVEIQVETVTNNLRFPGQFFDVETGLLYNFQRYYDPTSGRYMSADPIGFAGGENNLYGYVSNTPVNLRDVFGLQGECFSCSPCGPKYQPEFWNYPSTDPEMYKTYADLWRLILQRTNNCYTYALNRPYRPEIPYPWDLIAVRQNAPAIYDQLIKGLKAQGICPFREPGGVFDKRQITCNSVLYRVKTDLGDDFKGAQGTPEHPCCEEGYYPVYLVVAPKKDYEDYHWYRQDNDCSWSHKRGNNPIESLPDGTMPHEIEKHTYMNQKGDEVNYSEPCGYYCVRCIHPLPTDLLFKQLGHDDLYIPEEDLPDVRGIIEDLFGPFKPVYGPGE